MKMFLTLLIFSGIVLSFLVGVILFTMDKTKKRANQLLAIVFFSISCYAMSRFLFITGLMLDFPIYYKLVVPLYYLIPPCIYLYINIILAVRHGEKPYLWLHFLPAALVFIDVSPWFLVSEAERYAAVRSIIENQSAVFEVAPGIVPTWLHFLFRPVQGLIYLGFQGMLVFKVHKAFKGTIRTLKHKMIFRWAVVLTLVEAVIYLTAIFFGGLTILYHRETVFEVVYLPASLICISFIILTLYLYFSPALLYGYRIDGVVPDKDGQVSAIVPFVSGEDKTEAVDGGGLVRNEGISGSGGLVIEREPEITYLIPKMVIEPYTAEMLGIFRLCLEAEIVGGKLFKKQGLKVYQVAKLCKIPPRALSYLLNNVYHKRFNDFINEYRIKYVVERLIKDDWKGLTLEGLALESGFSSRTTFFLAFKKKHGMNPTQYLQMHRTDLPQNNF